MSDCIIWQGTMRASGYGRCHVGNRKWKSAHVVAWESVKGPVPKGMVLDHLCRNRACVNPDHLEPVTPTENTLRGLGPTAINKRKEVCKRGHKLTRHYSNPKWRRCRDCQLMHTKKYEAKIRAKRKAAAGDSA